MCNRILVWCLWFTRCLKLTDNYYIHNWETLWKIRLCIWGERFFGEEFYVVFDYFLLKFAFVCAKEKWFNFLSSEILKLLLMLSRKFFPQISYKKIINLFGVIDAFPGQQKFWEREIFVIFDSSHFQVFVLIQCLH